MSISSVQNYVDAVKQRVSFVGVKGGFSGNATTQTPGFWFANSLPGITAPAAKESGGTLYYANDVGTIPNPGAGHQITGYEVHTRPGGKVTTGRTRLMGFRLYDLIWGASGFVANSTAEQLVTSPPTLSRPDAQGSGIEFFMLIDSGASGSVSTSVTVKYTNHAGTPDVLNVLTGFNNFTNGSIITNISALPRPIGVTKVQSLTFSAAQSSAGAIVLLAMRQITACRSSMHTKIANMFETGLPTINGDEALVWASEPGNRGAFGLGATDASYVLEFAKG